MTSTGRLSRIFGAAILLIAVQFAALAAEAHVGHSHGPDEHSLQGHGAAGIEHSNSSAQVGLARAVSQAQAESATIKNGRDETFGSGACAIGCCGTGTGCCGAAIVEISPDFPPKACALHIGFARLIFVREVDPQGPRKPPRLFA